MKVTLGGMPGWLTGMPMDAEFDWYSRKNRLLKTGSPLVVLMFRAAFR